MASETGLQSHARAKAVRSRKRTHRHEVDPTKKSQNPEPDIDELRTKRALYYSRPTDERIEEAKRSNHGTVRSSVRSRTSRRKKDPIVKSSRKRRPARERHDSHQDLVYAYRQPDGSRTSGEDDDTLRSSATTVKITSPAIQTRSRRNPQIQDGARRRKDHYNEDSAGKPEPTELAASDTAAQSVRPSLQRENTTSETSAADGESGARSRDEAASATSSLHRNKPSQRNSSLLTSIFRSKSTQVAGSERRVDCLTCGSDDIPRSKSAKLACGHRMCHACLKRIFEMSVKDPAHMPPKCCTADHIPLKHVDSLFSTRFKVSWNKKYQEYTSKNRLYCPVRGCNEWIKPTSIRMDSAAGRKYGRCGKCKTKVCALCNGKWHTRSECPNDEETRNLIATAKEKGWQRCFNCKAMIELKEGCNHMTCRCTAEFCMLCAAPWKTCVCPWFNYANMADGDRLNHMRIPEVIQVVRRRANDVAGVHAQHQQLPRYGNAARTYQEEIDARRRQERADEDLAHRLQIAMALEPENIDGTAAARRTRPHQRPHQPVDVWGIGNAGAHFLNDDFVRNAAEVVMGTLNNAAAFGRRGERESGRRRSQAPGGVNGEGIFAASGLTPDAFGSESVLGVGPSPRPAQDRLRQVVQNAGPGDGGRPNRIGEWLARVGET